MRPIDKRFPNIFVDYKNRLFTKNMLKRVSHFDENIVIEKGIAYREWEPRRSKLGAALIKKISQIGLKEGNVVLYLGASHGYTPSFVSDIVGKGGFIFALEFSPESARDLVHICEQRSNMAPVIANANYPEEYKDKVVLQADVVYQDIAQKNQVEIFMKNCNAYLKSGGFGLLAIKARSIDVTRRPSDIFREVRIELEKHIAIVDYKELNPYEKDHAFFVCKKR